MKNLLSADIQHYKIVYLVQLHLLKILILISMSILDMELDLTDMDFFHTLMVDLVEM